MTSVIGVVKATTFLNDVSYTTAVSDSSVLDDVSGIVVHVEDIYWWRQWHCSSVKLLHFWMTSAILQAVSDNRIRNDVNGIVLLYDKCLDDISDTIAVSNNSVLWNSSCVRVLDDDSDIIVV